MKIEDHKLQIKSVKITFRLNLLCQFVLKRIKAELLIYKMKRNKVFVNLVKTGLTVACFILFLWQMRDCWEKFRNKTSHSGIRFVNSEESSKLLPCISFCTKEGFKTKGYFQNESAFLENSFSAEDIFHPTSISEFKNDSMFFVKATNNLIAGKAILC